MQRTYFVPSHLPGGAGAEGSACQYRRHKSLGFDPWVRKLPWRREWQPTPVFSYSRETEFALPCLVDSLPPLDWSQDLLPLSLIPVPLTTDTLLSDWPAANSAPAPRLYLISGPKGGRGKGSRYQESRQTLLLFYFFPDCCLLLVFFFSGPLGIGNWMGRHHSLQALELYYIIGEHPLWMQRFCAP